MRLISYTTADDDAIHSGIVLRDRVVSLAAATAAFGLPPCHDDMAGCIADADRTLATAHALR